MAGDLPVPEGQYSREKSGLAGGVLTFGMCYCSRAHSAMDPHGVKI
jgi:hypothetical protein